MAWLEPFYDAKYPGIYPACIEGQKIEPRDKKQGRGPAEDSVFLVASVPDPAGR